MVFILFNCCHLALFFKIMLLYWLTIKSLNEIIKLITAVRYGFRNKLEHLSLNTRLGWKGLPETNTLAYYGNRKLWP